ncbi:mechanosensitive ion channel family protein [Vibrio mytili]|uniref:Small-conductance mechanosensitive channel n=1 Tax=Vibrio mytili TaxID=50718 RepID=A0A0C3DJG7_9VIBR|nr:mechanosensitive ion channel family protein [Vibrio mytili]KIN11569.1 mechanosensitive ion channel protein MscS [Vibrio mytili]
MTFYPPIKTRLSLWLVVFSILFGVFSPQFVHATEASGDVTQTSNVQDGEAQTEAPEELSAEEIAINALGREMIELSEASKLATGDERDALQLQLFQKNEELRKQLALAISHQSMSNQKLVDLVKTQQTYSDGAVDYMLEKIKSSADELNEAKDEEKLTLINAYRQAQTYLDDSFESSWQNLNWLKALDAQDKRAEDKLKDSLDKRMQLQSASIQFLTKKINIIETQLSASPESEKATLQLNQLIIKQRLDIVTDSLSRLVELGDKVGLETSEYKRQVFEATGSISHFLLNGKVVLSILSHWSSTAVDWLGENAPQHLFQLFVFFLILLVARALAKLTRKIVKRTVASKNLKLSQLMQEFFISMSGKFVWVIGIMVGLSQIGLNLAPILTGFGIAGVIIGFALQDTLSNFAAGMMLLIYRPFDVGDFVYAGGVDGKVSHMSLVNTTIRTFDNQIIIVPNSKIWGDVIKNVTHERIRRVDMVFGIGYADDLLKAEQVLNDIVNSHPAVLRTPEPNIRVHTLNTSSVDFIVRPWVKTDDYWDVYWDMTKEVKLRFDREGISIPFPQQDVHLHMVEQAKQDA